MATDWTRSYGVGFEYWVLDKSTFREERELSRVEECEITRDLSDATVESASMTVGELLGEEEYVRCYLLATQDGRTERVCLGTFLAMTPEADMDGKGVERPLELHSPLRELQDDRPPIGYTVRAGTDVASALSSIFSRHHVKVGAIDADGATVPVDVTASDSDTWLSLGSAVLEAVGMEAVVDPTGTVVFVPEKDADALSESWTFSDDDLSILLPDARLSTDWHEVPNVVEAVVSQAGSHVTARAENASSMSPVSTASRGRTVLYRESNPDGVVSEEQAQAWAERTLAEKSTARRTLVYSHGYCPVKLGDCTRVVYSRHSLDVRGRVVRQVLRCSTDLEVEETIEFSQGVA